MDSDDRQCFCGCLYSAHAKQPGNNHLYVCAHHTEHQLSISATSPFIGCGHCGGSSDTCARYGCINARR